LWIAVARLLTEIEQGHVTMDGVVLKEKRKKVKPGSTVVLNDEYAIYVKGGAEKS
jgi:ribosome-associated protein